MGVFLFVNYYYSSKWQSGNLKVTFDQANNGKIYLLILYGSIMALISYFSNQPKLEKLTTKKAIELKKQADE